MTVLVVDGFDHYGVDAAGRTAMLEGAWAEATSGGSDTTRVAPRVPSFGAATGERALQIPPASGGSGKVARRVLGGDFAEVFVSFRVYKPALPQNNNSNRMVQFRDAGNSVLYALNIQSDGRLSLRTGNNGAELAISTLPVITAANWQHVGVRFVRHASAGILQVWINEVQVINASGLALGSTDVAQIAHNIGSAGSDLEPMWIDDLVVHDAAGTYNNSFLGDVRVATLYPDGDTATTGWTARRRAKFGNGILEIDGTTGGAFECADDTEFELGSGDYALEGFVRFLSLPTGSEKAVIFAKWRESDNLRSYELYKGGPSLDDGDLVFRISTDGQAGTVAVIHSWPWEPELNRWYHVAVTRDSGTAYLFIDGVQLGVGVADANTYFDGAAPFTGGALVSAANAIISGTEFDGFMEEVRITQGVARYNDDFTPPSAAFGRNVGADSDFNSVALLMGFDSAIADESSHGRTVTTRGSGISRNTPDDATDKFQTVDQTAPRDDTFIEAALVPATGTLELTANAGNTETVVLGSITYTFVNSLSSANDVLIGASIGDTIDNLVAAINGDAGEGSVYGTGTAANTDASAQALPGSQMLATALAAGTAGNSITSTETLANGSWINGATLSGGANIPGPIEFTLSDLPLETTGVRAAVLVTRAQKSDAGACQIQASFETSSGDQEAGADRAIGVSHAYYHDVIEEDPTTSGALTPSSFVGAKFVLNRTT